MKSEIAMADSAKSELCVLSSTAVNAVSGGNMQIVVQAYQAWMTCLKSLADSKGETQKALTRFS